MKFTDAAHAKEVLTATKEEAKVTRGEIKEFKKANGIKGDETPEDPKVAKKYSKLTDTLAKKEGIIEEAQNYLKENKPTKEKKERVFKYDYPAECTTADQKKKYRAEQRAAAKRAEKAKAKGEEPKKEKKGKKEEPTPEPAKKEKSKKDKSKKAED